MDKEYFLKRLAVTRPSIFESYNYDFLPAKFSVYDKVPITCHQHGTFYQRACSHLTGSGCQTCGDIKTGENRALTTQDFISKSMKRFGDYFGYSETKYVRKNIKLSVDCPRHGAIALTPDEHFQCKHGCPKCSLEIPREIKKNKILQKAKLVHGNKYDYSKVVFVNVNTKVEIGCPTHGSFWQDLYAHTVKGNTCPQCSRSSDRLTLKDFIEKSKIKYGDRYDYSKVIYVVNSAPVILLCKKHGEFTQRAGSHLAGNGCKKCFLEESKLSISDFVKNAKEVHGNKYDYSKVVYNGNKRPVEIICPTHGSFWQKPNTHVSSRNGCKFCAESKGEVAVENFLKKYGIEYVREYRIKSYLYRYDFYLPGFDIYIEFNGIQHYKPVEMFGGMQAFIGVKERDEKKKTLVKNTGGHLIVLTYLNLTEGSVESELIRRLKKIYSKWILVNGEVKVFKKINEVCSAFGIPTNTPERELNYVIEKKNPNFKVLF